MNFIKITRYTEWWEYKMVPLMSICYATTLLTGTPLIKMAPWLVFLLGSLIVGAIYVSVINDITDIDEDLASGKSNRMAAISPGLRWLIPGLCITAGLAFGWVLSASPLAAFLYLMAWVSFSLYSLPPFRLKTKGGFGVWGDACGSHLFPSLLMVAATFHFIGKPINWVWFSAVGVWALVYGFRGILWHQFFDRENDLKSGVNTYAAGIQPQSFQSKEKGLMLVELIAFTVMLYCLNLPFNFIFLGLYFIFLYLRTKKHGIKTIIILTPDGKPFQIFMGLFYQLFWPISLLVTAVSLGSSAWIILLVHILIFPTNIILVGKDAFRFVLRRLA
jgi:hypothetical protein